MQYIPGNGRIAEKIRHALLYLPELVHMRHFRGHGVHSPFVYGLIRNVLMYRNLPGSGPLYDLLRLQGIPTRRAAQIQHLHDYCNYTSFHLVEACGQPPIDKRTLYLALPDVDARRLLPLAQQLEGTASALCILSPRWDRSRSIGCEILLRYHRGTSIDNRAFQLLFYDDRLPKQHFNL